MKLVALVSFMLLLGFGAVAQKAKPKPKGKAPVKKSSKVKSKAGTKVKTTGEDEYDLFICYEGGGPCTFTILKNDTLVYNVNQQGKSYDLYIIPNKFDASTIADYSWYTSAPDNRSGKVQLNSNCLLKASKYLFNLASGDTKLTDGSTLWLSEKTYKEIAASKPASMTIDNGGAENFSSPSADESNVTISYKQKEITLEGFAIQNKEVGASGRKELSYLNISSNLLLLKADLDGTSMVLKQVRTGQK